MKMCHKRAVSGVVVSTLLLAGCADANPPTVPKIMPLPALRLNEGTVFDIDIETDIQLFAKDGSVKKTYKHKTKAEVTVAGGLAFAKAKKKLASDAALRTRALLTTEEVIPDSINVVPVVGVASGEIPANFDETMYDDSGNVVRSVGSAVGDDIPPAKVKTYVNGEVVAVANFTWSSVSGGFLLGTQTLTGYSAGSTVAIISSTISAASIELVSQPNFGKRLALAVKEQIREAGCLIAPAPAFAATRNVANYRYAVTSCVWEKRDFAIMSVALLGASALEIAGILAIAVYLAGWYGWTRLLYIMLKCFMSPF